MSDSPVPQLILSLGTLIIGGTLLYKLWTHGEPQQIKGLVSQDSRSEVIFDSDVTGRLITTQPDGSKKPENVTVKYSYASGEYRIETTQHRVLTFITDKRGPLAFACIECAMPIAQPNLDVLWWAKKPN
jgi:hypothetical protein